MNQSTEIEIRFRETKKTDFCRAVVERKEARRRLAETCQGDCPICTDPTRWCGCGWSGLKADWPAHQIAKEAAGSGFVCGLMPVEEFCAACDQWGHTHRGVLFWGPASKLCQTALQLSNGCSQLP